MTTFFSSPLLLSPLYNHEISPELGKAHLVIHPFSMLQIMHRW